MAKIAKPVVLTDKYWQSIDDAINAVFAKIFILPFLEVGISKKVIENSKADLLAAIKSGRLYFADGFLQGDFNKALTKEARKLNGRYNGTKKGFSFSSIPSEVQIAIAQANAATQAAAKTVIAKLDATNIYKVVQEADLVSKYNKVTGKMNAEFSKTLKNIAIPPKITTSQQDTIAKEWGENLELYITDFAEKEILELREQVRTKVLAGGRAENMQKVIQKTYSTTKAKARFLARQETSLLMSKMRETKYRDAGSTSYIWSGAMDEREREDHKLLQGKLISWDSPPVVDRKTGRRAHAGEDFGCRCTARPVFD